MKEIDVISVLLIIKIVRSTFGKTFLFDLFITDISYHFYICELKKNHKLLFVGIYKQGKVDILLSKICDHQHMPTNIIGGDLF